MFGAYLTERAGVFFFLSLDLCLELANHLPLLSHELFLLFSMRLLQALDLSLELSDAFFEFHLYKLLVTAGILLQLCNDLFILLFELLDFSSVLFRQICLKLLVLLLSLCLMLLKCFIHILKLSPQGLSGFITTLHRLV